jgi:uncharacterized iron-regulated membrane protein
MSDFTDLSDDTPQQVACPGCAKSVELTRDSATQLVRCPYCNTDFFASTDHSHLPVVDDTPPPAADADRDSAFNTLRIQQLTALRMGAIRSRSWWIMGFCMMMLTALNLIAKAAIYLALVHQPGWKPEWTPALELLAGLLAILFARFAWRKAAAFKREIDRSALVEPTAPPDFSTLSNGSDRWKNLENVH